ncbi:hypothetical protein GCM10007417_00520 [Glycocaulis alkaliphilus]|nr:hypothetical protein GCM10007417_00520 [Glycocaulis alkaliphilus]
MSPTLMRKPRRQGWPPMTCGSVVIRSSNCVLIDHPQMRGNSTLFPPQPQSIAARVWTRRGEASKPRAQLPGAELPLQGSQKFLADF